jgi:hypothetical protein
MSRPSHDSWDRKSALFAGVAAVSLLMGIVEYLDPTLVRPTGRWSILFGNLWDEFGSRGIWVYWISQSLVLASIALFSRKYRPLVSPADHDLYAYYRKLNIGACISIFSVLALNELFIRPNLPLVQNASTAPFVTVALFLNADVSGAAWFNTFIFLAALGFVQALAYMLLPKWQLPNEQNIYRSGLPKLDEYRGATFRINNRYESAAFFIWHRVLAPFAHIASSIPICTTINLIRGTI